SAAGFSLASERNRPLNLLNALPVNPGIYTTAACSKIELCARRRGGIPTMQKPTARILSGNAGQCLNNRFLQRLACASASPSQDDFQFGERLFNGREIRRIRRKEEELTGSSFNHLFHART